MTWHRTPHGRHSIRCGAGCPTLTDSTNALYALVGSAKLVRCASCIEQMFNFCPLPSVAPMHAPPAPIEPYTPAPGFTTLATQIADYKRRQSGDDDIAHF